MESREEMRKDTVKEEFVAAWTKPPQGQHKLNCDVAVRSENRVGYGFVLRNDQGRVVLAGKMEETASGSSTLLEARAMKYAVQTVKQYGRHAHIIESDSLALIHGLNGRSNPENYCDILMADIKMMAAEVECNTFQYVPRTGNCMAHQAAQGPNFICIEYTPAHLTPFSDADMIN